MAGNGRREWQAVSDDVMSDEQKQNSLLHVRSSVPLFPDTFVCLVLHDRIPPSH